MKTVLLIDDEVESITRFYEEALEEGGYCVKRYTTADQVLDDTQKESEIVAIILDIMMPNGRHYNNSESEFGLKTGVLLYKDLAKKFPKVPIFILTNVPEAEVAKSLYYESPIILEKLFNTPDEVVKIMNEKLDSLM